MDIQTKDYITMAASFIALLGFFLGLRQYKINQKWKKSEFAANLLNRLLDDEYLNLCCAILDWANRKFPVPEKYQNILRSKSFLHRGDLLAAAMIPENEKVGFTTIEVLYRDLFDHFFAYMELINHFIKIKLISINDVWQLRYWVEQIAKPRFAGEPVFDKFLKYYGYSGVIELIGKFKIKADSLEQHRY